jgi:DNA-binding transcriptional regulator LsrR (DeoR family)
MVKPTGTHTLAAKRGAHRPKASPLPEPRSAPDRLSLLADVAEMYYIDNKNQAQIARVVGVTRSMVSRMLSEAREKGIVEITVRRPLQPARDLEAALKDCFGLQSAHVVSIPAPEDAHLLQYLGQLGAQVLRRYLRPEIVLGLAWGSTISATIDAFAAGDPLPLKVVQLVGAMGARITEYDAHRLVSRLAEKLGAEGYYLNAPFICDSPATVQALLRSPGVSDTVQLGQATQVLLAGVGSTAPDYSSFYLAGYVPLQELQRLRRSGAVGDVCGLHFDLRGQACQDPLCRRLVTIQRSDLLRIPIRIGVAGGPGKIEPILGALRSGYINVLVTDNFTARHVLAQARASGAT